ncbi:oocyte zinc finger protein XlCOF6-like [Melanotaenia boesemani]|uniref:oocyte zinc finger protein XlCOF6-like n=1 Tax=Melanotaenia boesemani TaxID=1250792 RepID=UPI001C044883|nr:oocyte zinc finger protein XlCOF6-like [Melanotaenia boesemani]XP_041823341.1 oocyte zinc finger protein XlCOF6-like [Melanotaenia boesemani]
MEMLKIEQVIVGNDVKSNSAEIKSKSMVAPLQSYQHESVQCFQCFITFSDPKAKERHMRKSHRDQYKQHLQQTNTLFSCYKCDKSFSSSEELSQHQTVHDTDEKPFLCAYCQKNFYTFTELNKHRRYECTERQCLCRDCGALFPSPSRLRNHRIAVHLGHPVVNDDTNTFQCCKCGRGFQTEEELLHHQEEFANDSNCDVKMQGKKRGRKPKYAAQEVAVDCKKTEEAERSKGFSDLATEGSSSVELKIPCPETDCNCIFPSVVALRAHKKTTHRNPNRKASIAEYTCLTCGKSFSRESALKAHLTCHTEGEEAVEKR